MTRTTLSVTTLALAVSAVSAEPIGTSSSGCGLTAALEARANFIDECRPEAISLKRKQAVLETLPAQGGFTDFNKADRAKLDAVAEALAVHGREQVLEVRVISIPQAWTGIHGRAVVLISKTALRLLKGEELAALISHEVGHEYLWDEYHAARTEGANETLLKLELACDAIGVRGVQRLGGEPMRLIKALEKLESYNQRNFGAEIDLSSHPPTSQRKRRIRRLVASL